MPTIQRRNDELVNLLRPDFQHRYEPNFAWVNAVSAGMCLPQLRGFWPTSSVDSASTCYDVSGQGRAVSSLQNFPLYGIYNLCPYADFKRSSSQTLIRADEAGLSSVGGITIGGWFYFDAESMGNVTVLMSKWLTAGNQREYRLFKDATNFPNISISSDGTAIATVTGATALVVSSWYYIVGRLVSGVSIDLFVNDVVANRATLTKYTAASATVNPFNSAADFSIAADESGASNCLDGRVTLMHLCCAASATNPVASDTIVWSFFEQTRAGFGI